VCTSRRFWTHRRSISKRRCVWRLGTETMTTIGDSNERQEVPDNFEGRERPKSPALTVEDLQAAVDSVFTTEEKNFITEMLQP